MLHKLIPTKPDMGALLLLHLEELMLKSPRRAASALRELGVSFEDAHVFLLYKEPRNELKNR